MLMINWFCYRKSHVGDNTSAAQIRKNDIVDTAFDPVDQILLTLYFKMS